MRAETALWCALLVVLGATLPVAAVGTAGGGGASDMIDDRREGQQTVDPTPAAERTVHLEIGLLASGDANWTVRTYVPLDGDDERESFRELGQQYEDGTADVDIDASLFRRYVAAARSASNREMWLDDESVERSWTIENETGVLTLEFTWTNFARKVGDQYVVEDAFRSQNGTWLPRLEARQVLVIRPPDGVGLRESPERKGIRNGSLRWEGPQTFGPDYFRIVYSADAGRTPGTNESPSPGTTSPGVTPSPDPTPGMGLVLFGILVVGTGLGYIVLRRRPGSAGGPAPWGAGNGGDPPSAEAATIDEEGTAARSGDPDAGALADDDPEPTPDDPFAGVDVGMLSDEERVIRLLEANGGRMKQARIVKETDWSNAKVSQLLSSMDDDDEIDKLRIGRENLISLPDVEVDRLQE